MNRLTTDLIASSMTYHNPVKERELNLRGHRISAIENIGAALDNSAIDFTDNDIGQLGNFPLYPRLRTLLLARNRIANIQPNIASNIPGLETLVLTSNRISELADLEPLGGFKRLVYLSLVDNPVTKKEHYRAWVAWLCPSLRYLDFKRIRERERNQGLELFGSKRDDPTDLAKEILGRRSTSYVIPTFNEANDDRNNRPILTEEERKRMQTLLLNAKSLEEIAKLEKMLAEGRIPAEVRDS